MVGWWVWCDECGVYGIQMVFFVIFFGFILMILLSVVCMLVVYFVSMCCLLVLGMNGGIGIGLLFLLIVMNMMR